jgi:hypothetical protein
MRVVANVWDQVQLRPSNVVGRPSRPHQKNRAVLFAADHERLHFDEGPVVTYRFLLDYLLKAREELRQPRPVTA